MEKTLLVKLSTNKVVYKKSCLQVKFSTKISFLQVKCWNLNFMGQLKTNQIHVPKNISLKLLSLWYQP